MTLQKANELILYLLSIYEKNQKDPRGKPETECFDLKTLTPSKEWKPSPTRSRRPSGSRVLMDDPIVTRR
jgi:hypothetical protein